MNISLIREWSELLKWDTFGSSAHEKASFTSELQMFHLKEKLIA